MVTLYLKRHSNNKTNEQIYQFLVGHKAEHPLAVEYQDFQIFLYGSLEVQQLQLTGIKLFEKYEIQLINLKINVTQ